MIAPHAPATAPRAPVTAPRASASVLAGLVVAASLTTGCVRPFSPEASEAGVYKGAPDPRVRQSDETRDKALRERFELIQSR